VRVPLPWLREFAPGLPAGVAATQVAADLVRVGLEEEAIHGGGLTGPLVVGRVLDFADEPQKNGKTIRWCQVDVGEHNVGGTSLDAGGTPRGIVCGARNFMLGDAVVVALPGAVLPGGFAIAARKTYGHVSDGMICSARELGLGDDHAGIIRLAELGLADAIPGTDAIALLGLDEEVVEVNVTPDRGYALSIRGVAREYALSTGTEFTEPDLTPPAPTADGFAVRIEADAPIRGNAGCDRFVARVVHGVDPAAPTPRWMARRLEQAGMRPISLAVDVTNYVMLALGQPLHAYDLGKLAAPIVVRRARPGEKHTTLDDVERTLHPEDLLITDGAEILGIAGVMGGASSEVSAATKDILVEAAHFDQVSVARSARRHKLSTEASRRFERGVDSDLQARAAEYVVRLLVEHGGGTPGPVTDLDERPSPEPVTLRWDLPERIVGVAYTRAEIRDTLVSIGCRLVAEDDDTATLEVPTWRPDLKAGIDLVEEIARLRGYDRIPSVLPGAPSGRGLTHGQRVRRSVARALAEHGLVEVLTYPFVGADVHDKLGLPADDPRRAALRLANPLSDEQPFLRTNVISTLVEAVRRNVSRGATDLAVFEIGLVTRPPAGGLSPAPVPDGRARPDDATLAAIEAGVPPQPRRLALAMAGHREVPGWYGPGRAADWSDALEAALLVARTVGVEPVVTADGDHLPWHPGRCARLEIGGALFGHAGELHPKVVAALGLPPRTVAAEVDLDVLTAASGGIPAAAPVSTYPLAKEDVALVVDAAVPAGDVRAALLDGAGDLLEDVRLFDVYTGPQVGEARKSLAFALRFRAPDRTLTAKETAAARDAAVALAAERTGAVLRGAGA
jgi:phenylalanyl-tRNA synthetase beta chain